jgi:hypothetical protein
MSVLEIAYSDGQWDALANFKLAEIRSSASSTAPKSPSPISLADKMNNSVPPDRSLADIFNTQEQAISRAAPMAKVGPQKVGEELCTSCRRSKHYGPCLKPLRTRPTGEPHKTADFNFGMYGDDPSAGDNPSTSPHYHSGTSSIGSLTRAQEGRPADEQAATSFADLFRHLGITSLSDDTPPNQLTSNMRKTAYMPGGISPLTQTIFEQRGTPNPYEERVQVKSPPVAWGDEGTQRINRAFGQIDNAVDVSGIDHGGQPSGGPAVLG